MSTALAIRRSELATSAADWLPIPEAARLTGVNARTWQWRCRHDLAAKGLARLAPPPDSNGKPIWWIHRSVDRRLTQDADHRDLDALAELSSYHEQHVRIAQRKLHWITVLERSRSRYRTLGQAEAAVAAQARQDPVLGGRFSARSLRKARADYYRREGGGLPALVPRYRCGTGFQPVSDSGRSQPAVDYFYRLYHTEDRWSATLCHEFTRREARKQGWSWPASISATRAWLKKHDDLSLTELMRWGYKRWAHRHRPYIEQDYTSLAPGAWYVADSHQCKWFIRDRLGKPVRPWLVAIEDMHTRCIVGWHLAVATHQDAILLALRRAFLDFAVCDHLKLDNGRDYAARLFHGFSKAECRHLRQLHGKDWRNVLRHAQERTDCDRPEWEGLLPALGVDVCFAHPYEPQSKMIERWFRTMTERCARTLPGYCDTSPEQRTEALGDRVKHHPDELLTLTQARERFGQYVADYHATPHGSLNGQAPLSVWRSTPASLRVAQADALDLMLMVRGTRRVRANGVEVKFGRPYRYGRDAPGLQRLRGREVLVACDPQDASSVVCLDAKTRQFICRAPCNVALPAGTTGQDLRDANRQLGRALKEAKAAKGSAVDRLRAPERIAAERARERATALAATGTDDARPADPGTVLRPVRTGFEGASQAARRSAKSAAEVAERGPLDLSDWIEEEDTTTNQADDDGLGDFEDDIETELDSDEPGTGLPEQPPV